MTTTTSSLAASAVPVTAGTLPRHRHAGRTAATWASATVVAAAAILAVTGPVLAPDATTPDIMNTLLPPGSPGHPLGTDKLGRDVLKLLLAGARSALVGPLVIESGSMLLGLAIGGTAGYRRGAFDFLSSRFSDLVLALPVILVAIVVVGIFGSGYWTLVVLLIVLFLPSDLKIVRSEVVVEAGKPYVEAARLLGVRGPGVLVRHILPNIAPVVAANYLVNLAIAIITFSSLTYLGVGVPPQAADWGRQLADGREIMTTNPAAVLAPAIAIIAVSCAVNLLGDAWLRHAGKERA